MKGRTKVQKPVKEEPSRKKEAVPPKQEAPAEPAEPAPPKAEPGVVTSAKTEESAEPSTVVPPASEAREVPVPRSLISSESDDGYERPRGRSESETKSPKRAEPEIYHEALEEVLEEEGEDRRGRKGRKASKGKQRQGSKGSQGKRDASKGSHKTNASKGSKGKGGKPKGKGKGKKGGKAKSKSKEERRDAQDFERSAPPSSTASAPAASGVVLQGRRSTSYRIEAHEDEEDDRDDVGGGMWQQTTDGNWFKWTTSGWKPCEEVNAPPQYFTAAELHEKERAERKKKPPPEPAEPPRRKKEVEENRPKVKKEHRVKNEPNDEDDPRRRRDRERDDHRDRDRSRREGRESRREPDRRQDDRDRDRGERRRGDGGSERDRDRDRRKDEDRDRRPPKEERSPPSKKARAAAPGGGDDDDDGDGSDRSHHSSDYTYETDSEEAVPSSAGALGRARGRGRGQAPSDESRSTVKTSEIRGLLQEQAKKQQGDRLKPSLSQVRIETFKGSRSHYRDWKRTLEAQRALFRLEDHELALLIYLSCEGEPRQILNQLEMDEIQEPGGLGRVLKLLEDSYGSRSDERFEEKQEAYLSYRRTPGTSVAAYIATLKRLRQEYLKEDEGTTISDRSFAQRLLSRASLHRRERMDIFFSAGGKYASAAIEKVLRFRCQHVHVDEKKPYAPRKQQFVSRKPDKGSGHYRRSDRRSGRAGGRHHAHVADAENPDDPEDEDDEDADEEDFEKEVLMGNLGPDDAEDDEDYYDYEGQNWDDNEWWGEEEEDTYEMDDLRDAYAAGWKAKQKAAEGRKARGYHETKKGGGKGKGKKGGGKRPPDTRSVEDRKKKSKCSACGQYGHWHNDPECPKCRGPSSPASGSAVGSSTANFTGMANSETASQSKSDGVKVSQVNWTFMMRHGDEDDELGGWERIHEYESEASLSDSSSEYEMPFARGVSSAEPAKGKSKYKVDVRKVLKALELMAEDEGTRKRLEKKEKKLAQLDVERDEKRRKKLERAQRHINNFQSTDANAQEMLMMLPHLTKDEKRHLYDALKREKEEEELRYFRPDYKKEQLRRKDERHGGYSAAKPKLKASSSDPPPPRESRELPEPIRKKRMEAFRRELYESNLDRKGRLRPSEASDVPKGSQEACPHAYEKLQWGANAYAHWANCRKCGLRKVLYFSHEHGALVTEKAKNETYVMPGQASEVILDSGCRTAVAGEAWHHMFQQQLAEKMRGFPVEHDEIFRFGAGRPVLSTEAFVYPVQLGSQGPVSWLRLAVVKRTQEDDRVAHCPALVGPSEMRRWGVILDFA